VRLSAGKGRKLNNSAAAELTSRDSRNRTRKQGKIRETSIRQGLDARRADGGLRGKVTVAGDRESHTESKNFVGEKEEQIP